ncbi:uncharacterized protein LOC133716655 [Rosa rugosa]|uniref:uncharacterized protein LOC133716655 n=1 Tax=Rosa rugosa TaxID=74645 RepID=UPI002B411208|nr:uncharacterized protein LOC133716655 [Rosa rugosa]
MTREESLLIIKNYAEKIEIFLDTHTRAVKTPPANPRLHTRPEYTNSTQSAPKEELNPQSKADCHLHSALQSPQSGERELVIGANGRRRACTRRGGPRRRLQGEGVEHERWALLQAQALEAQHGVRHVRSLPHLHSHRHEIRRAREAKHRKLLLNVGGPDMVSCVQMAGTVADIRGFNLSLIKSVSASSVDHVVVSPADISMDISKLVQTLGISPISFGDCVGLTVEL